MATNIRTAAVVWEGGMRFRGGTSGGPTVTLDADSVAGPGPMVTLLVAAAACSGADVVHILEKMRITLRRYRMDVTGVRAEEHPRRYRSLHVVFTLAGDGLDEDKARRAVDLSVTKYCSVLQSLDPDIPVSYDIVVE
jgi:putative redox protein